MFINTTSEAVNNKPINVVCDWDGVIQEICLLWTLNAMKNEDIFRDYLDLSKYSNDYAKLREDIWEREEYALLPLLRKPNKEIPKSVNDAFYDVYIKDPLFYKHAPMVTGATIIGSLIGRNECTSVTFLSHCILPSHATQKSAMMTEMYGNNPKIRFVGLQGGLKHKQNKSDWMNENTPEWNLFIDDSPKVILDILNNCDCRNKNIICPQYGYNKGFEIEYNDLIEEKEVEFRYFRSLIV